MAEEAFISLVESSKMLYDKTDKIFKNAHLKEAQWNIIGTAFNISGKEAQLKFKALRQKYVREKNLENIETRSGAGSSKRTKWPQMPLLRFLDDYIKPRKTISNISLEMVNEGEIGNEDMLEENFVDSILEIENCSENWCQQVDIMEAAAVTLQNSVEPISKSSCRRSTNDEQSLPKSTPTSSNIPSPVATQQNNLEPVKKRKKRNFSDSSNDVLSGVIMKLSDSLDSEITHDKTENISAQSHIKPQIQAFGAYITEQLNRLPDNISDFIMAKVTHMISEKILENLYNNDNL